MSQLCILHVRTMSRLYSDVATLSFDVMTLQFGVKFSCHDSNPSVLMPLTNVMTLIPNVATLSPDVTFGVVF